MLRFFCTVPKRFLIAVGVGFWVLNGEFCLGRNLPTFMLYLSVPLVIVPHYTFEKSGCRLKSESTLPTVGLPHKNPAVG
jgi:hypothetical protein